MDLTRAVTAASSIARSAPATALEVSLRAVLAACRASLPACWRSDGEQAARTPSTASTDKEERKANGEECVESERMGNSGSVFRNATRAQLRPASRVLKSGNRCSRAAARVDRSGFRDRR